MKCFFYRKILFIYLFMRDTQRERQRHRQRENQVPCWEPDVDLIAGPQDHTLSRRQVLNCWVTYLNEQIPLISGKVHTGGFKGYRCYSFSSSLTPFLPSFFSFLWKMSYIYKNRIVQWAPTYPSPTFNNYQISADIIPFISFIPSQIILKYNIHFLKLGEDNTQVFFLLFFKLCISFMM